MRRKLTILAAGVVLALGVCTAHAADQYRVAVLPAWKNWGHVHDFDYAFKAAGWSWTNCVETAEQIDWLSRNLDKFDLLLAPPLFHYEKGKLADPDYKRPYNMDKLAPAIAKWIQEGGCFLGVDMNYPMAMEWYRKMDPLMDISACVDPKDMKTVFKCNYFGPPVVENNDSMLYFPRSVEPGFMWGHMVIPPERMEDTAWKVIATCGHGKGFPTLVVRRWGKGIIVLSSTRSYVPELMQNIRVNQKFSQLGEAWRKYDPYHPTYLASYQPHHFRRNAEISDILAPDPYPYSAAKGDDSDLALVARRVELARAASDGVNPVFCVPQAFGSEPVPIWRNMALQAIVHGAKGIIWYAWNEGNPKAGGMVYNDELVAAAEVLLAQLKLLAPAILGDAENQPRMFTAPPGGEPVSDTLLGSKNVPRKNLYDDSHTLHGMVCRDPKAGTRYLILVNSSKEPLKMDLPLPEADKLTGINGAFDDSVIRLEDGVARIELGKFGSGIWYWDGPRPVMPRPMSDFAVRKLPARASGKTWTVAPAGGTHTNLQQAIDAAGDGDVISVAEGNWGRIVSDNKLIDIVATGDRGKTVISGNRNRAATLTQRYQGDMAFETNTLIRGFTIQNGDSTLDAFRPKFGGGVIGGTLVDCVVQNNKARYGGGAAFANILDCIFQRNNATLNGGGASVCKITASRFERNSASFDGGAAEFSEVTDSVLRNNRAGRRGGATSFGSVTRCEVIGNSADQTCGGITRSTTRNSIIARNSAKEGNGGIGDTSPSFCTIAYNTIERGQGSGVGGTAPDCLIAYNTCKSDPLARQVSGYRDGYGRNVWFASNTTNIPPKVGTFDASAFVNASRDNYQLTLAAPFIDAGRDTFFSRDESDFYGNRRVSGAGAEPGAAELPMSLQPIYEFDVAQANPLASSAVKLSLLVNTGREQPLPEVSREALVFDGKTSSARARSSIPDIGGSRWPRYRWEVEFRTQDKGPIFTIGDALTVAVTPKGKLHITSIIGGRPARTNVIESAGNVRGRNFNKLVIETDTFGGPQAAVTATLNGKPLPVKTGWDSIGFFNFGRNPAPTFGTCKSEYFKGEVKSFRLTGFAD